MKILISALVGLLSISSASASSALEIIAPKEVRPGEVFFIEIKEIPGKDLVGGKFAGEPLKIFRWGDKFGALIGVDVAAKEGEKEIVVEEFAPGDAPAPMQRFLVRVLRSDFPEVKVGRPRLTAAQLKRIDKEKKLIRQALQKSESSPLWSDWFDYPLGSSPVSKGGEFGLVRKSALGRTHHAGVDFGGTTGTSVRSSNTGRVVLVGNFLLEGKTIIIDHGLGLFSLYMHLNNVAVKVGDLVTRGMVIGTLGRTGRSTGPHLHLAFLLDGKRVDPLRLLALGEKIFAKNAGEVLRSDKDSLLNLVELAKEKLRKEPIYFFTTEVTKNILVGRGRKSKKIRKKTEVVSSKEILLAVPDPGRGIQTVRAEVATRGTEIQRPLNILKITPPECSAEKRGGGGVNTNFKVVCDGEEQKVLGAAHVVFSDKRGPGESLNNGSKIIYVPYSDELAEGQIIILGRLYLESKIKEAGKELERLAVYSKAVSGRLVSAIFPEELLFNIGLIEHIDHDEFGALGPVKTGEKVLVQLALNKEDTFRYAVSSAKALCLMQIMPSTYREVRQLYPQAKLPVSSERGSCEHKESIKAAYLVLDSKLARMPLGFQQAFLREPEKYGVFLAAAYNGGSDRAAEWYQKFTPERLAKILKDSFQESMPRKKGPRETWFFVKKYMEIAKEFLED